jgi:geranylgeranyl pyrophosphate synthase
MHEWLALARERIDEAFEESLGSLNWHSELQFMARHVLPGAGKAVRPALMLWTYRELTGALHEIPRWLVEWALALEMLHSYSLIHDDLPAMDNDDFRRGKPTLHKLRNEASAILAGDALLSGAFEVLSLSDTTDDTKVRRATVELSRASGGWGMVSGQMRDMYESSAESATIESQLAALDRVHREKTGALFGAALAMGVIAAESGPQPERVARAREWGVELGLLFQIVDDILDATATSKELGKTAGKDAQSGKRTYVKLLGIDEASRRAEQKKSLLGESACSWGMASDKALPILNFFTQRKT